MVAADYVAISTYTMNARPENFARTAQCRDERLLGRDTPADGLLVPPSTLQRIDLIEGLETLDRLGALPANWDGYGALTISDKTMSNSKCALQQLLRGAPAAEIAPNPNGTVSFNWSTERGLAHLEVGETQFSFFCKPRGSVTTLVEGKADQVAHELGELVGAVLYPSIQSVAAISQVKFTAGDERPDR